MTKSIVGMSNVEYLCYRIKELKEDRDYWKDLSKKWEALADRWEKIAIERKQENEPV